jgi:hypothetical protein
MVKKEKTIAELQAEVKRLEEANKRKALSKKISDLKYGKAKAKIKKTYGNFADNIIKNFG